MHIQLQPPSQNPLLVFINIKHLLGIESWAFDIQLAVKGININWDFAAAGVGGNPHGVNFDGSVFELPNFEEFYYLFCNSRLQVNIRVGPQYGMVKDIVVFVRPHGLIIHADGNSQPNYFVDGRKLRYSNPRQINYNKL